MTTPNQTTRDVDWVAFHLRKVADSNFYGRFTVVLEGGQVRRIIKEESLVPPKISEK